MMLMLLIIFDVAIDVTRVLDENVVKEIYVIYDANVVEEFDIFHIIDVYVVNDDTAVVVDAVVFSVIGFI